LAGFGVVIGSATNFLRTCNKSVLRKYAIGLKRALPKQHRSPWPTQEHMEKGGRVMVELAESCGQVISRAWDSRRMNRILLGAAVCREADQARADHRGAGPPRCAKAYSTL
jgi:hypothetical protein